MNQEEFRKKLSELPEEAPDRIDAAMLAEAKRVNDGSLVSLDDVNSDLREYSGRLVLRIPKSLHRELKDAAAREGVSLNQYMLYKLAR